MNVIRIITLIVLVQYGFLPRALAMEGSHKRAADSECEESRPTKQGKSEIETSTANDVVNDLIEALQARNREDFDRIVRFCEIGEISVKDYQKLSDLARTSYQPDIEKIIRLELHNLDQAALLKVLRDSLQSGNWDIVESIVKEKGINYNFAYTLNQDSTPDEFVTALSVALENGKTELHKVRWLVDCGATLNREAMEQGLKNALEQRNYELATYLLDHGANVHLGRYSYDPTELKLLFDYGWFDSSAPLIGWISKLGTSPQLLDCIRYFLLYGFYQPDLFSTVFVDKENLSSDQVLVNKLRDLSLQSDKSQDSAPIQRSYTSLRKGAVYKLLLCIEHIVKTLFRDLPISSALILYHDEKQIPEIKNLLEKSQNVKDVNQAAIIAAGRGNTFLLNTILQRTKILTAESIIEALYAAGIARRIESFKALIDSTKLPHEELQKVLQRLLRPLIMRGDEEFIELLLHAARNATIVLDTVPFETVLDILLASDSCTEKHPRFKAIKRMLEEYSSNHISPSVEAIPPYFLPDVEMRPSLGFLFNFK